MDRTEVASIRRAGPVWVVLFALAGLAWMVAIRQARGMGAGTMDVGLPPFLLMWVTMMAAMMFPSVAPAAILWVRTIRGDGRERAARIASFLCGYLLAWAGYGVAAFVVMAAVDHVVGTAPAVAPWLGAGLFAAAGLYQLTPLKQACLRQCRSPLGLVVMYTGYRGPARDLRVGAHHGLFCVGCCWGLMVILVAVGVMNLVAMVALSAVIFLEKLWRGRPGLARVVGVAFLLIAGLAPFHPWLLPGLRVAAPMGM